MGERWGKMGKKWVKNEITGVQKTALMHASAHLVRAAVAAGVQPRRDRIAVCHPRADPWKGRRSRAVDILLAGVRACLPAPVARRIHNSGVGLVAELLPHEQVCILRNGKADVAIEGSAGQIGRDVGCRVNRDDCAVRVLEDSARVDDGRVFRIAV